MCLASDVLRSLPVDWSNWHSVEAHRRRPLTTEATTRVVLLGVGGGGNPKAVKSGFANAVVVGDRWYFVDAGEGVHKQMWRAGLAVNHTFDTARPVLRAGFVTHLHVDHIMDLGNLFLGSWPNRDIDIYGPGPAGLPIPTYPPERVHELLYPENPTPGLTDTLDLIFRSFAYNLNTRMADEGRVNLTTLVHAHDIDPGVVGNGLSPEQSAPPMEPIIVFEDDRVRVSAILVQHAPVYPAFGYRFDTDDGSVVFSGDTGRCDNVVRLAQGADVLVHEIMDIEPMMARITKLPNFESIYNHLKSSHSTADDVGDVATRAGVKTLVLSHHVPGESTISEEGWETSVRPHFDGEIVCGVDLDAFSLTRS
jgi:ribonuclease BN (tRNA processing enzyme)